MEKKKYSWSRTPGGKYTHIFLTPHIEGKIPRDYIKKGDIVVAYLTCNTRYGENEIYQPELFKECPFGSMEIYFNRPMHGSEIISSTPLNPQHKDKPWMIEIDPDQYPPYEG